VFQAKGKVHVSKFTRVFLVVCCVVALAFGVAACGSSGSATTTVTSTVEQQNDNESNDNNDNENDDNEKDDNGNDNESVSKQKKECLKHNKGYPENCSNIP
jgi:hypothetical protein